MQHCRADQQPHSECMVRDWPQKTPLRGNPWPPIMRKRSHCLQQSQSQCSVLPQTTRVYIITFQNKVSSQFSPKTWELKICEATFTHIIFYRAYNRVYPPERAGDFSPVSAICKLIDIILPVRDAYVPINVGCNKFLRFLSVPVLSNVCSQQDIDKEIVQKKTRFLIRTA